MADIDFDALHNISPGKHLYQFYKGSEDFLRVMSCYFQAGLEKSQACLWLVSKSIGVENAYQHALANIPHFTAYHGSGQFRILSGEEWYLTGGLFDEVKAIGNALTYLEQSKKQGFQILRGSGDAASIPHAEWPKIQAYERKMDAWINANPVIGLCAYPILDCSLTDTKSVLDCHDDVLSGRF